MGFDGFVVGDWNAHGQVPGCSNGSCPAAFNAGLDMFMVPQDWKALYKNTLYQVESGEISRRGSTMPSAGFCASRCEPVCSRGASPRADRWPAAGDHRLSRSIGRWPGGRCVSPGAAEEQRRDPTLGAGFSRAGGRRRRRQHHASRAAGGPSPGRARATPTRISRSHLDLGWHSEGRRSRGWDGHPEPEGTLRGEARRGHRGLR